MRKQTAIALAVAAAAALGAFFAWEVSEAGRVAIDDAYITFSFSKNLAEGHGPIYGHGLRVEGYSNFLWLLVLAVGFFFRPGDDPLVIARLAAIPFMVLLGVATYRLCRNKAGPVWSFAAVAMVALNADAVNGFLMGLETLPAAALLVLGFMLYAGSLSRPSLARWVVPAFVGVALMRIDGFVPLGYVLAFEAARRLVKREGTVRDYLRWAAPAVVYLIWFAWRWWYYGMPLPSTYYAKALIPKLLPKRGMQYLSDELYGSGMFLALPFAAVILLRRSVAGIALVLFVLGHCFYVVKAGGDWMPYGRFMVPLLPLVAVIIIWGGVELRELLRPRIKSGSVLLLALPLAALCFMVKRTERHLMSHPYQVGKLGYSAEQGQHVGNLKAAASMLRLALSPGSRLVTDYGGVMAYYTDAAPIEVWGLCNAAIATRGGTEGINPIFGRTCPSCYPELDPEFFHVWMPLVRDLQAFHSHREVVANVWQTDTIGRYIDFQNGFVSGRVMVPSENRAVYFLERRQPRATYLPRPAAGGALIDYPFEPQGRASGL